MFLNCSNHRSENWTKEQVDAVGDMGERIIEDYDFPKVSAVIKEEEIVTNQEGVFIYSQDGCEINPKYISPDEYNALVKFEHFVKVHNELTKEEIDEFLNCESCLFLNKLNKSMPNFVSDLRRHGAKSVAIMYVSDILYSNKNFGYCVK